MTALTRFWSAAQTPVKPVQMILWKPLQSIVKSHQSLYAAAPTFRKWGVKAVLKYYKAAPTVPKEMDVLKWWSPHNGPFTRHPTGATVTVLSLPATQVSVARLFSGPSFVLNSLRTKVDDR